MRALAGEMIRAALLRPKCWFGAAVLVVVTMAAFAQGARADISARGVLPPGAPQMALSKAGKALLTIYVADGGSEKVQAAVKDLERCLEMMTGADFQVRAGDLPADGRPGIHVGARKDFPSGEIPDGMEQEEVFLRTTKDGQLLLVGGGSLGVSHAVYTFLDGLGCRWCFPGETWEVVPRRPDLSVSLDGRHKPDFSIQRKIWMGHGMHSAKIRQDYADWMRRNRMGSPLEPRTSHSWPGIDPKKDLAEHPDWFALVDTERKTTKPCYANPEVIARGVQRALTFFRDNPDVPMVSVSAPDGLGFCECDSCKKLAGVVETHEAHGTTFGTTAGGRLVSLASETIFRYANEVADAVAAEFPGKYVGILAYSAYAHPPSFDLRPNVYVELTRGYRRTPLTQAEQIAAFAKRAKLLGIYEYYDVEQWSWDLPGAARASNLDYLAGSIPYYYQNNIRSLQGEMSNNWAPNGIGYWVISRLLWDTGADVRAVEEDFYRASFGPAAAPLKRFYRRWESGQSLDARTLALAYRDLQKAVELTTDDPDCRQRVDGIRMYLHFLKHYIKPQQSGSAETDAENWKKKWGEEEARARVGYLGSYVSRLMDTHMTHSYAFNRYLRPRGEALGCDTTGAMSPGAIPTAEEVDEFFRKDLEDLDLANLKDVPAELFSRKLVPLKTARPELVAGGTGKIEINGGRAKTLFVRATKGQAVKLEFDQASVSQFQFIPLDAFEKGIQDLVRSRPEAPEGSMLRLEAPEDGYYVIDMTAKPVRIGSPAVLIGGRGIKIQNAVLYFFVPKGTPRFLVRTSAHGGPTFTIRNSRRAVVFDTQKAATREFLIEVPEGDDGTVWSFSGPKDANAIASVELVGVPNYFSLSPEQLLVPAEALR